MATFNQTRVGGKLFKQLALAAALCTTGVAHAGVVTFEGDVSPFIFNGEGVTDGIHTISTYNNAGGFVAAILDGADPTQCVGDEFRCPNNNPSNYYATLADSFTYLEANDGGAFRLESLSASFIGTGTALPYGIILVEALNAALQVQQTVRIDLSGPGAGGNYGFNNYAVGSFLTNEYMYYRFVGYACPTAGSCNRNSNAANFAIDNIVTSGVVPEPATLGLLGLGLLGMGALRRRTQAA